MGLIEVHHLTKTFKTFERKEGVWGGIQNLFVRQYRDLKAVDEISFAIDRGEMVGYIGANGAGKSTTIKMLTGILVPSSGEVKVQDFVPYRDRSTYTRTIESSLVNAPSFGGTSRWLSRFNFSKKIYGVSDRDYRERLKTFDEALISSLYCIPTVRKLSLGQRMRCDLAASLLHNPTVLFLDEPTIGLDVVAKENIRQFLRRINRELNVTVLLTTHDLSDIEELCRRIMIIDKGKLLFDGVLSELRDRLACKSQIKFELKEPQTVNFLSLRLNSDVEFEQLDGMHCQVIFDKKIVASAELIKLLVNSLPVRDIIIEDTTIEEIVREI
jgi:ABC-2 type transport system ATP-binding protein